MSLGVRGNMWVKGDCRLLFLFSPHKISISLAKQKEETGTTERKKKSGSRGTGLTIQCESFGNPDTAAGPKARAVFMAAPV